MESIFLTCAVIGGTLLVCQVVLGALGLGHHDVGHEPGFDHQFEHDHDHDHHHGDQSWIVGMLTFRTVVAALTFFGLGGMIATKSTEEPGLPLGIALVSGAAAFLLVGWVMKMMSRLQADGTVRISRTVGMTGTVYLSVPGNNSGTGKVTVKVQNRTVEYQAVTRQEALETGTPVKVVAVVGPDTLDVIPVPQAERISHV